MKAFTLLMILVAATRIGLAQELYVNSEPASNMATGAIGFRVSTEIKPLGSRIGLRTVPEVMVGLSRHLMVHASLYGSNFYQNEYRFEGFSVYGKYRFLAIDQAQSHFRIAGYARAALQRNPLIYQEISLQGDNSGFMGGLVFTQLLHKVAFSASTDFTYATGNLSSPYPFGSSREQLGYTLSAGYLLLPKSYTSYRQTNVNVYLEFIGKNGGPRYGSYLDIAPAVQFIFNSTARLDFSYQRQLTGELSRLSATTFLVRLEYNLFNAFKTQ